MSTILGSVLFFLSALSWVVLVLFWRRLRRMAAVLLIDAASLARREAEITKCIDRLAMDMARREAEITKCIDRLAMDIKAQHDRVARMLGKDRDILDTKTLDLYKDRDVKGH